MDGGILERAKAISVKHKVKEVLRTRQKHRQSNNGQPRSNGLQRAPELPLSASPIGQSRSNGPEIVPALPLSASPINQWLGDLVQNVTAEETATGPHHRLNSTAQLPRPSDSQMPSSIYNDAVSLEYEIGNSLENNSL